MTGSSSSCLVLEKPPLIEGSLLPSVCSVLAKILEALPDVQPNTVTQQLFCCRSMPTIQITEFVSRFTDFGGIPEEFLMGALMLMDRALQTGTFCQKSAVFK